MTEFVTALVLQFKKIESDDKTKSDTFYSNSIILCYNYIKHTKVFKKRFCWIIDSIIDYNINISKYNPLPLAIAVIKNSYHRCSTKIGVLKNFAKLAGKHLCQSVRPHLIEKKTLVQVFSCEFCEILRTSILQNTSGRLLPKESDHPRKDLINIQSIDDNECFK